MSVKKILKLVNNERKDSKLMSHKSCDATSIDVCPHIDYADCTSYAYDKCTKEDYAACYNHSDDLCTLDMDTNMCYNGIEDVEE